MFKLVPSMPDGTSVIQQETKVSRLKILIAIFVSTMPSAMANAGDLRVPEQYSTVAAAVASAQQGDRILIGPGTYPVSALAPPPMELTFEAAETGTVTIVGSGSAIFVLAGDSVSFEFRGLAFTGGAPAISSTARLRVTDCRFFLNTGGITQGGGSIWVDRCHFEDGSGVQYGGGIAINAGVFPAVVRRTNFVRCASEHYGGGIHAGTSSWAAIVVDQCSFLDCHATNAYGGGIAHYNGFLDLRDSVFHSCTGSGGGALFLQGNSPARVENCTFIANQSIRSQGTGPQTFVGSAFCGSQVVTGTWIDGGGNQFAIDCSEDCDGNGIPDIDERARSQESDCDANRTLDVCEISSKLDCDGNGRLDSCDIVDAIAGDCDSDGLLDSCELAAGAIDVDENGVPDECDPDCDGDRVIDAMEILAGAEDCDGNGIPDSCVEVADVLFDTGAQRKLLINSVLSTLSWGCGTPAASQPQRWTAQAFTLPSSCTGYQITSIVVNGSPSPSSLPTLGWKIWVRREDGRRPVPADLVAEGSVPLPIPVDDPRASPLNEQYRMPVDVGLAAGDYWLTVYGINGAGNGTFGWYGNPPEAIRIPATAMWRSAQYPTPGFGLYTLSTIQQAPGLDPADRWRTVFRLEGRPGIVDCNGNGIDDFEEIAADPSRDCDSNRRPDSCDADCDKDGEPDSCEIAGGLPDDNGNGLPDECECPADVDFNGVVNAVDLAAILSVWGTSGGLYPRADINRDGTVGAADLSMLLGGWGACPG